jgi:UDP-glucose 4-epimerase
MELSDKRVLVTGGAGFIGSHVVDRLLISGAQVRAIDDLSVGRPENLAGAIEAGASLTVGDVRDAELMRNELEGIDVVIHMACGNLRQSLGNPRLTHDINATGTLVTALAAAEARAHRFLYVSSSEAYGSAVRPGRMAEDHPLVPTTVYGASKAAGELYAQACMRTHHLPVVVVRPFNSYGPREHVAGDSAEVIPKFAARISAGLPPVIFGDGDQTRDFTWVEETAAGIVAAAASDSLVGETVNIAFGSRVSIRDIATMLLEILDAPDLTLEYADPRPGDVASHWADMTKARRVLGFEAVVSIEEGLRRYVHWLQNGGADVETAEPEVVCNW